MKGHFAPEIYASELKEFIDYLNEPREKTKKSLRDEYWEDSYIYAFSVDSCRDIMYKLIATELKRAMKSNELEEIRSLLYQCSFMKYAPDGLSGGYDHSGRFFEAMYYISCLGFDSVYRIFPEGLPLCDNGYPVTVLNTNLLLCILYNTSQNKVYDQDSVIVKVMNSLSSKGDKALRGVTRCLLGILLHDVERFNEGLPLVLDNFNRMSSILDESKRVLCQFAVSLIVIAKKFLTEREFNSILIPEHKLFSKPYCDYILSKNSFEQQIFFEYPEPISELNDLLLTPIPLTVLHQPYLNNEQYSKRERNKFYLDHETLELNFILDYRKRKGE